MGTRKWNGQIERTGRFVDHILQLLTLRFGAAAVLCTRTLVHARLDSCLDMCGGVAKGSNNEKAHKPKRTSKSSKAKTKQKSKKT